MTLPFPSSNYDFVKCVTSQGEDIENKDNEIWNSECKGALFHPGINSWHDPVHYLLYIKKFLLVFRCGDVIVFM